MSIRQRWFRRSRQWWDDHFEVLEFLLPLALAGVFGGWIMRHGGWAVVAPMLEGKRDSIYGTMAALLGSLLGFVIAAAAIIVGEARRLGFLRDAGQMKNLLRVLRQSIWALGFGTIASIVALVFDSDAAGLKWPPVLVLFAATLAAERVKRTVWILHAVMEHAAASDGR